MYSRGVARFIDGAFLSSNVRIVNKPVALEFALPVPASIDLNHFQRETPGRFDLMQVGRVDFGEAMQRRGHQVKAVGRPQKHRIREGDGCVDRLLDNRCIRGQPPPEAAGLVPLELAHRRMERFAIPPAFAESARIAVIAADGMSHCNGHSKVFSG
jgi:hypothetical protein